MSAQIIQLRDYQNPKDLERMRLELEQQAIEIANVALIGPGGIDDLPVIYESSLGWIVPDKDPPKAS